MAYLSNEIQLRNSWLRIDLSKQKKEEKNVQHVICKFQISFKPTVSSKET